MCLSHWHPCEMPTLPIVLSKVCDLSKHYVGVCELPNLTRDPSPHQQATQQSIYNPQS